MVRVCIIYKTREAQLPALDTKAVLDLRSASLCGNQVTGAIWWHNGKLQSFANFSLFQTAFL